MNTTTVSDTSNGTAITARADGRQDRRRRWEMTPDHVRFFLPKTSSNPAKPELGEEVTSEGEALVQAFQKGQVFYTVVAWKAVADISEHPPTIVKQAIPVDARLAKAGS